MVGGDAGGGGPSGGGMGVCPQGLVRVFMLLYGGAGTPKNEASELKRLLMLTVVGLRVRVVTGGVSQ